MTNSKRGLSSFTLRNIAMLIMLIDHTGATLFPDQLWLRYIGRLAFPIFAFLIVEGYHHTKNFPKYMLRLLILAIVTDLPFGLMVYGTWYYSPFQNVIWTFLIGLLGIWAIDHCYQKWSKGLANLLSLLIFISLYTLADWLQTDYHGFGVLTLIGFFLFRGQSYKCKIAQSLVLIFVNILLTNFETLMAIGWDNLKLYLDYYGFNIISPQIFAPLALILIWMYNGRAGHHSPLSQTANYLFYPIHMLILGLLATHFF